MFSKTIRFYIFSKIKLFKLPIYGPNLQKIRYGFLAAKYKKPLLKEQF